MKIESFQDLIVCQRAFELQQEVFDVSKKFPREEMFSLTDQVRRSSRSVGANTCEAWQKCRYKVNFISKLSDSNAEQAETEHWINIAMSIYRAISIRNCLPNVKKLAGCSEA